MTKAERARSERKDKFLAVSHILYGLLEELEFSECLAGANCPGYSFKQALDSSAKKMDSEDAEE